MRQNGFCFSLLSLSPYANVGDVECAMCSSVAVLGW